MSTQDVRLENRVPTQSTPRGLSHIAVPSRDLDQSKRFFVDVLGGRLTGDGPALARAEFDNFGIVMGLQAG